MSLNDIDELSILVNHDELHKQKEVKDLIKLMKNKLNENKN